MQPPPTHAEHAEPIHRVAAPSAPPAPAPDAKTLHSEDLLQGRSSVALLHKGMRYTLHHTRQGKLILTK